MRIAYLDVTCGIAGDMFLASLIDAGLELKSLEDMLGRLPLTGEYALHARRVRRGALMGTHVNVEVFRGSAPAKHEHQHPHEHAHEHEHDHDQVHAHEHDHEHDHDHEHSHDHQHEHDHEHSHDHQHDHDHEHEHDHDHVHAHDHHDHGRSYSQIAEMVRESSLPEKVKSDSLAVFRLIGEVEARLHGETLETIHFHEVGGVDSIVDIVGVCAGLHLLNVEQVYSSAVTDGYGTLKCAHGVMPVPAPAALELLKGVPLRSCGIEKELVTPTGAGLLRHFCRGFGPRPAMVVDSIGYGAGTRELAERANLVRISIGESLDESISDGHRSPAEDRHDHTDAAHHTIHEHGGHEHGGHE